MAKCQVSIGANADAKLDINIDHTESGVKTTIAAVQGLSQNCDVLDPDPKAGIGLVKVCNHKLITEEKDGTGRVDTLDYTGDFSSNLTITFILDLFSDCSGPSWCCEGRVKDIKVTLVRLERYIPVVPDWTLAEFKDLHFKDVAFDDGCKSPPWSLCCKDQNIPLKLECEKHVVLEKPQKLLLTIKGEAKLDYSIWHKVG